MNEIELKKWLTNNLLNYIIYDVNNTNINISDVVNRLMEDLKNYG